MGRRSLKVLSRFAAHVKSSSLTQLMQLRVELELVDFIQLSVHIHALTIVGSRWPCSNCSAFLPVIDVVSRAWCLQRNSKAAKRMDTHARRSLLVSCVKNLINMTVSTNRKWDQNLYLNANFCCFVMCSVKLSVAPCHTTERSRNTE